MKNTKLSIIGMALMATTTLATSAAAAELVGGSVQLDYSAFTDETDFSRVGLEGSLELAFTREFSVQGDLGYQSFGESDADSTIYGLHAIYHLNDDTSLGAFYSRDDIDGGDIDLYGVEVGHEVNGFEIESYLSHVEGDGDSGTLLGISGRYEFENTIGLTGSFDRIDEGDVDINFVGLTLDRDVSPNMNLFVKVGSADASVTGLGSGSETYVGIGGKISFGAERGATFEQRSLTGLIPGL